MLKGQTDTGEECLATKGIQYAFSILI